MAYQTFTITAHKVLDTIPQKAIDYVRGVLLDQEVHYEHDITYRFLYGGEYTKKEFAVLLSHMSMFYGQPEFIEGIGCEFIETDCSSAKSKPVLIEVAYDANGDLFDIYGRPLCNNPNTAVLCGIEKDLFKTYFVTEAFSDLQNWVKIRKDSFVDFQPSIKDYDAFVAAVNALPKEGYVYRVGSGKYSDIYDMYAHFKMDEPSWRR